MDTEKHKENELRKLSEIYQICTGSDARVTE